MADDNQNRAREADAEREAEIASEMDRVDQDPDQVSEGDRNLGTQSAPSGTPREDDELEVDEESEDDEMDVEDEEPEADELEGDGTPEDELEGDGTPEDELEGEDEESEAESEEDEQA